MSLNTDLKGGSSQEVLNGDLHYLKQRIYLVLLTHLSRNFLSDDSRGDGGEAQWWRHLLDSNTRTGHEFRECWDLLQREANECCNYLGRELEGTIAIGPDIAIELREGDSSRQALTEQREELREAVVREALLRHPNQAARPAVAYPQLDKLSTAWKLGLPGPTTGMSTPVFKEVLALHLFLPSLACKEVVGKRIGARGAIAGPFGDELMCAHLNYLETPAGGATTTSSCALSTSATRAR